MLETKLEKVIDVWPPVVHIYDKRTGPLKEGALALCGAKLMGIEIRQDCEVCKKCKEIFEREGCF